MTPEEQARKHIDDLLDKAGWIFQNASEADIFAGLGVAIREFPLPGHGFADYLLYINGKAAGLIEAKKESSSLSGVVQPDKYSQGMPVELPAWQRPLAFSYQSTGAETCSNNGLDPEPRARPVFAVYSLIREPENQVEGNLKRAERLRQSLLLKRSSREPGDSTGNECLTPEKKV